MTKVNEFEKNLTEHEREILYETKRRENNSDTEEDSEYYKKIMLLFGKISSQKIVIDTAQKFLAEESKR